MEQSATPYYIFGLIVLFIGSGWIMNIIDIAHMTEILTGEGILRIAGIFIPPLGAIMGWFV